jgi:hypothetical protein
MRIRVLDAALVLLSLLVVGGFSVFAYAGGGKSSSVIIEASGKRWVYPLGVNRTERVRGPIGDTVVVISEGSAWIEDSPCRDKICIQMGKVSRARQWIACLPNKIIVSIGGGQGEEKLDAVSY